MKVYVAGAATLLPPFPAETDPKAKRLPKVDRIALAVARSALGSASADGVALIVGTCYGGLQATVDFLEGVATRGPAFGSPTAFHESVHHAPAGQISILLGMTGLSLTCSDRELSGETALKAGADLIGGVRARGALIVCADELVPALTGAFQSFGSTLEPGEGAAALLLTAEPTDVELTGVRLTSQVSSTLRFSCPPAEAQLNPSRGLIRVAEAYARLKAGGGPERVVSFAQGGGEAIVELARA
jgi:hypothetical protein